MASTEELSGLYPFLNGVAKDPQREHASLLLSIEEKAKHSVEVKQRFFAQHAEDVLSVAQAIANVYRSNGRMYAMGNGGSSCDAAHFAVEFQHPVTAGRPALPASNLGADSALTTALANDVGVAQIYARQLTAQANAADGLIGFSTSGNSQNLMAAFHVAHELGMTTLGICGADGGEMKRSAYLDHCLVVATDSIHRVQEVHVLCYHILWDLVHTLLADTRGKLEERR